MTKRHSESDLPCESRSNVIKILQEQINELMVYKSDYQNVVSQLQIAENALEMKEAEHKLKCDEYESELKASKEENQILIDQTLRFKMQQINENNNIIKESDEKVKAVEEKYKKKIKEIKSSDYSGKYEEAQQEIQNLREENEKLRNQASESSSISSERDQELSELMKENKKLKKQISELESSNSELQSDLSTISADRKKKSDLLVRQRSKNQYDKLRKKKNDNEMAQKIEEYKKELLLKEDKIARANVAVENEQRLRRKIEKRSDKVRKQATDSITKLQGVITKLQNENKALREIKQQAEENESSMEVELIFLRNQKKQLEEKLMEANKVHQKNTKLQNVVGQLKNAVENLENSANSFESDSNMKESDLRSILIKHFEDVDDDTEWCVLITMVDKALDEIDALKSQSKITSQKSQERKEKNRRLKEELDECKQTLVDKQKEFDNIKSTMIIKMAAGKKSYFSKNTKAGNSSILESTTMDKASESNAIPIEAQVLACDLRDINMYRMIIVDKIDKSNFKARNAIMKANSKLEQKEFNPVSARTLALFAVFAIRFTHFHRSDPFDLTTILSYTRPIGRKAVEIEEILGKNIDTLIEENEKLQSREEESMQSEKSAQESNEHLSDEINELKEKLEAQRREKEGLQAQVKTIIAEKEEMIDQVKYNNVVKELENAKQESKDLSLQLNSVKEELSRLIDTVNQKASSDEEFGEQVKDLEAENEELRIKVSELQKELEVYYLANKEKNRDILSLERKNNNNRTMPEVESIMINSSNMRSEQRSARRASRVSFNKNSQSGQNGFFLSENVRDGLAQIQNTILGNSHHNF